ncbi:MAG: hypothetical protein HC905_14620 [Bacteroidales bacterium]|nr:hypothetical protein [Bacteroidales bacterium]
MIFLAVPSKYTIYHKLLNNDLYNNFLPRLYKELESRKIPVVKLLDHYQKSDELLYYPTDAHWTQAGLDIALKKTLMVIDSVKYELNRGEIN